MFRKNYTIKINLPGGIVATGDLYAIIEAAEAARVGEMQFGSRQQLFCKAADKYGAGFLHSLEAAGIFFETGKELCPNIVSSYVTEGVFGKSAWVSEGLYKDILEGFDHRPGIKINLVDSGQSFVPYFTGHLNFVSSSLNNHWHLFVRGPGTNELHEWKTAVYSADIPEISKLLGAEFSAMRQGGGFGEQLYRRLTGDRSLSGMPAAPDLRLPPFRLPYYEGVNRYGNKYWLGIYRREETFPVAFLKDLCMICRRTRIGQLYATPWKSLLIKGIEEDDLPLWEFILGKYRMNVRHASNELNWQTEDLSPDGLRLKRFLVRQLDQDDIRTEGLSFAVKLQRGSGLPGSIVIRKQAGIRPGQWKMLDRYELWHTGDFDPFSRELKLYRKDLEKEDLYPYVVSLCKEFYSLQSQRSPFEQGEAARYPEMDSREETETILECRHCLTQYYPGFGDPENGVPPGTPTDQVGTGYTCSVCGAGRDDLVTVEKMVPIGGQS